MSKRWGGRSSFRTSLRGFSMRFERSEPETAERPYSPTQPLEGVSMTSSRSQLTVRWYWRQAIIATTLVVVAPPMLVMWLERMGFIDSAILGVVASVVGSMMASTLGAAIWMQFARSNDVVFSDLLPWGFLRRMTMEKRILDSTKLMRETNLSATWAASSSNLQVKTLEKLASALEATDPYTHGHSRRVARLSCMIAKQLGLPRKKIRLI
jgi:uncharacterized membrane protein YeaQ/YmgE (transglycosylase-associated protein family)